MPTLFYDPIFLTHETGQHPESPARLEAVLEGLKESELFPTDGPRECPEVDMDVLCRVHASDYVDHVRRVATAGGGFLDIDTVVSSTSYDAALRAAGAAVAAVEGALAGEFPSAFCAVRPPGHHALPSRGMGFCLFNNIAVAAKHACAALGLARVLIVDWDVHHGNGTQAVFDSDASVFYLSLHRHPHYPGTGSILERGRGEAEGTNLNVQLAGGTGHDEFIEELGGALEEAARFGAQLVLVSCGFDAVAGDMLGGLMLEPESYAEATSMVVELARGSGNAPVVSVLEGGYCLDRLGECAREHFEKLP